MPIIWDILIISALTYVTPFCLWIGWLGAASLFRSRASQPAKPRNRFRILIPSHNESEIIDKTLGGLVNLTYPRERFEVIVIADNCTDNTAELARNHDVTVWERSDLTQKSKGHALSWAIEKLFQGDAGDFDGVVVIDADTLVHPRLLDWFSHYLDLGCDYIQGYYNGSNKESSWRTKLLSYALSLINGAYLAGSHASGISVALRGNGMCFSKDGLARNPWQAATLAEDIEFSWKLRLRGERVAFAPEAMVYGELVSGNHKGTVSQRQRWEVGRRLLRQLFTKEIVRSSTLSFWSKGIALVDLYMVPIARLAMGLSLGTLFIAASYMFSGSLASFYGLWVMMLTFCIGIYAISPVLGGYIKASYLLALGHFPKYLLWKFALLFRQGPQSWQRTQREST